MRLLPILLLLSGCASIFGPDDWEPSGHHYLGGMVTNTGGTLGTVHLYRANPNEKPKVESVEIAPGKFVNVNVWAYRCAGSDIESAYALDNDIYLCNQQFKKQHELAHRKGMKHTEWVGNCATIIEAGYNTGYKAGQEICNVNNAEIVSK